MYMLYSHNNIIIHTCIIQTQDIIHVIQTFCNDFSNVISGQRVEEEKVALLQTVVITLSLQHARTNIIVERE